MPNQAVEAQSEESIAIRGAGVHNLKDVDCDVPRQRLVVMSGPHKSVTAGHLRPVLAAAEGGGA